MTGCRADPPARRLFGAGGCLFGAGMLLAAAAGAQEERAPGEPLPLPPEAQDGGAVSIGRLEAVGGDAAGALDPAAGGFAGNPWRGVPGDRAAALLERAPAPARSPAMNDLLRRLLASAGEPEPGGLAEGAFAARRAALLARLGAFAEAARIAESVAAARWTRAEVHFWRGENAPACALVRDAAGVEPAPEWRRALALCQALDGDSIGAELTLALLYDRADAADAPFLRLVGGLLGHVAAGGPALGDAAGFAATWAAGAALRAADAAALGPAAARALALHPGAAAEVRLAAAERAAATGALPPDELATAYRRPAFLADELAAAEPAPGADAMARARLLQAAEAAAAGERRAALLAALWTPAPGWPGLGPLARAAEAAALEAAPGARLARFAPVMARGLAAAGRGAAAAAWLRVLEDPEARWRAAPLAAAVGGGWDAAAARRWLEEAPAGAGPAHVERAFAVLDAAGRNPGAAAWAAFLDAPPGVTLAAPNVGLRYGLRDAARAGRAGEAVLYALIAIGEAGPAAANGLALGAAIRALRALGLEDDARALAVEALAEAAP